MPPRITEGTPEPLGVTIDTLGINVAVFSAHATSIEICLFDPIGETETARLTLPARTGDIFHGHFAGIAPGTRYGLRVQGLFAPHDGHRFNAAKLLLDPYAIAIDRPFQLHRAMCGHRGDSPDDGPDEADSAGFMPKAIVTPPLAPLAPESFVPWDRTVLYELHVRGFTKQRDDIPGDIRGTFAGLGHEASIAYLTALGVTSVELMPACAWLDERHLPPLGLRNYWGYNPITYLAPDPRLAPGGWAEIRAAIAALERAGIETILDVVLNHSGESDELGPTVSLRGLDNASYYRLLPDNAARYVNDAGCGNILALDHPFAARLALDSLRAWAQFGGVHGFRFDLAATLGRRPGGFDAAAPLLTAITQDPMLRRLKLIAEPWDIGPGGYQLGVFPSVWGEWNDHFRDGVRRFWRGDDGLHGELATRLAGSQDAFGNRFRPSRSVNFVTAHDGFTLADLVSYVHKHNDANGEHNRDGTDANNSWNHGIEGPSDDPAVLAARRRDQCNLLATLLFARGTPMLSMGAEFGQTQAGNNNAYAQDSPIAWLDWTAADTSLLDFTRRLIGIRRAHAALRHDRFLSGRPLPGTTLADVEWRRPDGGSMTEADWRDSAGTTLVLALAAQEDIDDRLDRVVVVLHRGAAPVLVVLPEPRPGHGWRILADTNTRDERDASDSIDAAPRSVVLIAEIADPASRQRGVPRPLLDRLSTAAGIAPEWWEVDGTRHIVSDATRQALLGGMGLAAGTRGEAEDAMRLLAMDRELRPLPRALVVREGESAVLDLALDAAAAPRATALVVARDGGETQIERIGPADGVVTDAIATDGSPYRIWRVSLPPLPIGRHRVALEHRPEIECHLTVAPARCYLPPDLAAGARRFGIAAHLYTLRRDGDQGIGDFTTLGVLSANAAAQGAVTIGLNPLHALFGTQRERASPYHPSDRHFLDPIYLDVAGLATTPAARGLLDAHAAEVAAMSAAPAVDYTRVWALKRAVLDAEFANFDPATPGFATFVANGGAAMQRFACFEAISETLPGTPWTAWPAGLRDAAGAEVAVFGAANAARIRFHQFLQFLSDRALATTAATARAAGLGLGFYRDLAVGCAPDGAEAWAAGNRFARGASVGAPPDPFSANGQIWHLPPPNPLTMADSGYAGFAGLLAANMRQAGALRIDHVMGLTRLFWVPDGGSGADGAYVAYPLDDLLGQAALESARAGCAVVGEDLGTVPDGFRERLAQAGVLSYRVLWFERDGIAFRAPAAYPAQSVACVATHDLATLIGWWSGADIAERATLGQIPAQTVAAAQAEREQEKVALVEALMREGLLRTRPDPAAPLSPDAAAAVHRYVARTPAELVLAQADDVGGEPDGVNLPGTDRERPNWRRRITVPASGLFTTPLAGAILAGLRDERPPANSATRS